MQLDLIALAVVGFLEVILSLWNGRNGLSGRALRFEFLLRVLLGLPVSLYIFSADSAGFSGLLRLFLTAAWIGHLFSWKKLALYFAFFSSGSLFLAILIAMPPQPFHLRWICFAVLLQALYLVILSSIRRRLFSKQLRLLALLRERRGLKQIEKEFSRVQAALQPEIRQNTPVWQTGLLLLVRIDALDLAVAADDVRGAERIWSQLQFMIRVQLSGKGLLLSAPGNPVAGLMPALSDADIVSRGMQCYFLLQSLLGRLAHYYKAQVRRSSMAFEVTALLKWGQWLGLSAGADSPAFLFPQALDTIAGFKPALPFRIWIDPELFARLDFVFEKKKIYQVSGFSSPEYLVPEFSKNGEGLEPAKDFYQRLAFAKN